MNKACLFLISLVFLFFLSINPLNAKPVCELYLLENFDSLSETQKAELEEYYRKEASSTAQEAHALYAKAMHLLITNLSSGKIQKTDPEVGKNIVALLDKAIALDPKHAEAHLAKVLLVTYDYKDLVSIQTYEKILKMFPNNFYSFFRTAHSNDKIFYDQTITIDDIPLALQFNIDSGFYIKSIPATSNRILEVTSNKSIESLSALSSLVSANVNFQIVNTFQKLFNKAFDNSENHYRQAIKNLKGHEQMFFKFRLAKLYLLTLSLRYKMISAYNSKNYYKALALLEEINTFYAQEDQKPLAKEISALLTKLKENPLNLQLTFIKESTIPSSHSKAAFNVLTAATSNNFITTIEVPRNISIAYHANAQSQEYQIPFKNFSTVTCSYFLANEPKINLSETAPTVSIQYVTNNFVVHTPFIISDNSILIPESVSLNVFKKLSSIDNQTGIPNNFSLRMHPYYIITSTKNISVTLNSYYDYN